ncbi:MAG: HAMP domain-containing protein [Acidobacteriota bacterium]|nr:HAMP domain-containing protein [Acidobacteriota bacterium]
MSSSSSRTESGAGLGETDLAVVIAAGGALVAVAGPAAASVRNVGSSRSGDVVTFEMDRVTGNRVNRLAMKIIGGGWPVRLTGGAAAELHLLPLPREDENARADAFLGSIDRGMLAAVTLAGAIAILLTWVLAHRALAPIEELREASRALARGELSRRVAIGAGDEIGDLARAFNTMAGQLEQQHALRRDLLHDVAHELRTPLTALRCRIESITDGVAENPAQSLSGARDEVVHLSRLIDDLQELALAEARELRFEIAATPLAPVAVSAVSAAGSTAMPALPSTCPRDLPSALMPCGCAR